MRYLNSLTAISALAVATLLTSCASGPRTDTAISAFEGDPRLGEKVEQACFVRQLEGFTDNTRDTVVLSFGANKDYLVTINNICQSLRHARSIAPLRSMSCLREGSELLVSESAFGLGPNNGIGDDRCRVDSIYRWNADAVGADPSEDNQSEDKSDDKDAATESK